MYTVMLADDEPPVLDTLSDSIHWQDFGVDTILKASDGERALELFSRSHVDLLITDIRMPHMNGLELLAEVRARYQDTHCIVLSAYGEFEHARKSIQLGVENYLLKPFQYDELERTIEKALDNIYMRRSNSQDLFRYNILLRWLTGNISSEELAERSVIININTFLPEYCAACIKGVNEHTGLPALSEACARKLSERHAVQWCWDYNGYAAFIVGGERLDAPAIRATIQEEAARMDAASAVVVAVGDIVQDSESVALSYKSACNALSAPANRPELPCISGLEPGLGERLKDCSPVVRCAMRYVQTHYAEGISIKGFCARFKVNAGYLGYLFKKETGVFFNNYLSQYRINRSIPLLANAELRISDVAAKTGFSSSSYFIQCFRRHTALSPEQYRRTHFHIFEV